MSKSTKAANTSAKSSKATAAKKADKKTFNPTKLAVYSILKKLGATKSGQARSLKQISAADPENVSAADARVYCTWGAKKKLMGISNLEDVRGNAFYLTAAGVKALATAIKAGKA